MMGRGSGRLLVAVLLVLTGVLLGASSALGDPRPTSPFTELEGKSVTEGHDKSVSIQVHIPCPDLDGYGSRECRVPWAKLVNGTAFAGSDYVPGQLWMTGYCWCIFAGYWVPWGPDPSIHFYPGQTSTLYTGDSKGGKQGISIPTDSGDTVEVFKLQFAVEVQSFSGPNGCTECGDSPADDTTYYYEVPITIRQGYKIISLGGSSLGQRLRSLLGKGISHHRLADLGFVKVGGQWLYRVPDKHEQRVTLTRTLTVPVTGSPRATVIGDQNLTPSTGSADQLGQNIPVFQGDAGARYVLSAPKAGTITSWRFLSGGVATGKQFELAVLAPVDQSGMNWRLIATSAPVSVTTAAGSDAVNGPFQVQIPIDAGERIALMPVDDSSTPIETGTQGTDGIRYFSQPFNGGLGSSQQVASTADNGQVVPIQATEVLTP